jgi:hypothetical protein
MSDAKTEISLNGLRYKSKKSGSPYEGMRTGDTMSCMKCGVHKPRSFGSFKQLLGNAAFFCGDCRVVNKK